MITLAVWLSTETGKYPATREENMIATATAAIHVASETASLMKPRNRLIKIDKPIIEKTAISAQCINNSR